MRAGVLAAAEVVPVPGRAALVVAADLLQREAAGLAELGRQLDDRRVRRQRRGQVDDEWNQLLPPPKITPAALANAVVKALQDGVEDVYPGDVAQEWLARWRDNPKALEKELSS